MEKNKLNPLNALPHPTAINLPLHLYQSTARAKTNSRYITQATPINTVPFPNYTSCLLKQEKVPNGKAKRYCPAYESTCAGFIGGAAEGDTR